MYNNYEQRCSQDLSGPYVNAFFYYILLLNKALSKRINRKVIKMLREGQVRIPSGCAISGIFSKSGERISGDKIIKSIATMHDRSNGLGGGFA